MSRDLCLKWNNHSSSFAKLLDNLHLKELFSDATLMCQGKFYPVHRFVLSTCSAYFEEMFRFCVQLSNKYPFIIVKDIHPIQMEALLCYMYKGEVNVPQDMLPDLIKAAETFKIKGLAVPDDDYLPSRSRKRNLVPSSSPHHRKSCKLENAFVNNENKTNKSQDTENDIASFDTDCSEPIIKQEPNAVIPIDDEIDQVSLKEDTFQEDVAYHTFVDTSLFDNSNQDDLPNTPFDNNSNTEWEESENFELKEDSNNCTLENISGVLSQEILNAEKDNSSDDRQRYRSVHQCPACSYQSYVAANVRRHYRIHTGEKPFKCPVCSHRASDKANLKRHIITHPDYLKSMNPHP